VIYRLLLFLTLIGAPGACARVPTTPYVMALPGPGRTLEQFQADDGVCREWAAQRDRETAAAAKAQAYGAGRRQQTYDMAYLQCMYAKGNRIPGAGAAEPSPKTP
jgi:hypothetical protein